MAYFPQFLGGIVALIVASLFAAFSGMFSPHAPANPPFPVVSIPAATSSIPLPAPPQGTNTPATSSAPQQASAQSQDKRVQQPPTPIKAASSTPKQPAAPAATQAVSAPAPVASSSSGSSSLDSAASALRAALVNIICYAPAGGSLRSISGSGVFIDPKGIILTNAHVAQYFLLADRHISCTIRTGSPAIDEYEAALIYISPAWIHANANILTQTAPIGTGEYDFALLAVTKSATAAPLPSPFPYLPLAQLPPPSGSPVVIASYGAQFLESNQIQSSLFPTVVFGSVKDVFTFAVNTIDVLALGGSAAAQEGSSGGGVADASRTLVGTITTSTVQGATNTRSLDAISASYIRSEYAREMGNSLDVLLGEQTAAAVADFAPQIPVLESIITANLP